MIYCFRAIELNARNSLFIHMLCWNPIYARDVVDSLLKSVFMHDPYLQYIGVMKSLVNYQCEFTLCLFCYIFPELEMWTTICNFFDQYVQGKHISLRCASSYPNIFGIRIFENVKSNFFYFLNFWLAWHENQGLKPILHNQYDIYCR